MTTAREEPPAGDMRGEPLTRHTPPSVRDLLAVTGLVVRIEVGTLLCRLGVHRMMPHDLRFPSEVLAEFPDAPYQQSFEGIWWRGCWCGAHMQPLGLTRSPIR